MANISITLTQQDATASLATIRNHQVTMDRPEAKGGSNAGPMGGEMLRASLGGCFMSNMRAAIAARNDVAVEQIILAVTATLSSQPDRFSAIDLHVTATADPAKLQKLVAIAGRSCIVANTLRSAVALTIST